MEEPINVRYVFAFMLAISDPKGYVIGTDVAIARRLNMPTNEFQRCVEVLMQPDKDSNSKEHEGRRVILSDGERGYFMVNYLTYREMHDRDQRREYMRTYMKGYRKNGPLTERKHVLTPLTQEASSTSEAASSSGGRESREEGVELPPRLDTPKFKEAWAEYIEHRKDRKLKPLGSKGIRNQWRILERYGPDVAVLAIESTIANGYQGIFPEKIKLGFNGNGTHKHGSLRAEDLPPILDP